MMFPIFKKKHECDDMQPVAVSHGKPGTDVTHVLKLCPTCGDWDVDTLAGYWTIDQFILNNKDKSP